MKKKKIVEIPLHPNKVFNYYFTLHRSNLTAQAVRLDLRLPDIYSTKAYFLELPQHNINQYNTESNFFVHHFSIKLRFYFRKKNVPYCMSYDKRNAASVAYSLA